METTTERHTQYLRLSSGRTLCYAKYGADHGVPMIYFHGWPSSRLQACTLDQIGQELGVTIYAPDRPGIGKSDHQAGRVLKDYPHEIREFLDLLGVRERVYLFGVSGGGPYAIATACELNHQVISTSIACGAPPLAEHNNLNEMILPYRILLGMRPILPALLKSTLPFTKWAASKNYQQAPLSWYTKTLALTDQQILKGEEATAFALDSFRESLVNGAPGLITDADAYTSRWDLDYNTISHPIHFWHGKADQNIPFQMAEHLVAQIPNAIPHWLEEEGHYTLPINYAREIMETLLISNDT